MLQHMPHFLFLSCLCDARLNAAIEKPFPFILNVRFLDAATVRYWPEAAEFIFMNIRLSDTSAFEEW